MTTPAQILIGDCLENLRSLDAVYIDSLVTDPPAGIAFMNQEWDKDKGGRDAWINWMAEVMTEAMRVLKPGAHALVWALPRTSHWTATALENAGFEIRDVITHHFGSGFPKNHNISLAIDKHLGVERPVVGNKPQAGAKFKLAEELIDNGGFNAGDRTDYDLTASGSDEARQMEGWGTALKPGSEHWILARKPLDGTVAANVLAHRTGGINIDECRIETGEVRTGSGKQSGVTGWGTGKEGGNRYEEGRWPANVILTHSQACGLYCVDDCPVRAMGDEARFFKIFPFEFEIHLKNRFIYCPKPTVEEKEAGLSNRTARNVNDGRQTEIDNPYQRGETARKNTHPTVKSIRLMDYLIRLVTPPGGRVLDCFMGSGTTGVAAVLGGWSFTGIEREPEFFEIAESRINHAAKQKNSAMAGQSDQTNKSAMAGEVGNAADPHQLRLLG